MIPESTATTQALSYPILYTEADASLLGLESHFLIRTPDTNDFTGDFHVLACQTERTTQKLARAIKRANPSATLKVHPPMANGLLIEYSGFHTFMGELLCSMDYEVWDSSLESALNCEKFQELASDIIEEHLQGLIKKTEESKLLDFLIERATANSYVVDKRWLEPLRAELEKRYNSKSAIKPDLPKSSKTAKELEPSLQAQVYELLFARDFYATIADKIHKYVGTHYEPIEDGEVERQIIECIEEMFVGEEKPGTVASCLQWFKKKTYVSLKKVNAGGLNLKNKILDIAFDANGELELHQSEHTPERIFTFCSDVEYNANADRTQLDTLLSCLDEPYKTIFVRTLAASLALPEVRKRLGRGVKCLLMTGTGSNGKDTVMIPIQRIFGEAMTGVTSVSMLQYDEGRKFGCYGIVGSLINYNTEAKRVKELAECSFLKALVTGDSVSIERKNKDEHLYKPSCVAIFSTNEDTVFKNGKEAVKSRYAEIPFRKTYSTHPTPKQLKADPRFHDDPKFITEQVAPAFLNLLLHELVNLLNEGINYSATDADMDEARYSNDRIYRYFTDAGIIEGTEGVSLPLSAAWNIYLQGLEKDGVDEQQRLRNSKLYCSDEQQFSSWVKKSFPGIESKQKRVGGTKMRVLSGLVYADDENLLRHQDNVDTASIPAKTEAKTEPRHPETDLNHCLDLSQGVSGVSQQVSQLEPLPDKDCLSVLANCTERLGEWVAIYPGTDDDDWRPCRVFEPVQKSRKDKTYFWCLFYGETQPKKVATWKIEPDPNEF